ncbi:MAG: hypothetical protein HFF32_01225 [Flavonifractor sp.]|nr:hypothetical protein [Flavonifractor sp.]
MKGDSVMDTRKKMLGSRLLAGLLSLMLVVGMLPAAGAEGYTPKLNQTTLSLSLGGTPETLSVLTPPDGITITKVTWESSNNSVATVKNGTVTAVGKGQARITANVTWTETETPPPATETLPPATETLPPATETLPPATETLPPATETLPPATETLPSATETIEPTAPVDPSGNPEGGETEGESDASSKISQPPATVSAEPPLLSKSSVAIPLSNNGNTKAITCEVTVSDGNISATGVTLNKTTASIGVNETLQLTATVAPSNATTKAVTWESKAPTVASVSSSGLVKGLKAGTADITATVTNADGTKKTATCRITVTANSLTISPTSLTMSLSGSGSTGSIKGTTVPSTFAKNITWTTNNRNIVAVGSSNSSSYTGATCNLYAKGTGTATITAEVTINGQKFSKSCSVTVGNIADTIEYSTNGDDVVHFVASDFNRVCNDVFGGSTRLDYIVFTSVPSSYGTLYYDYSTNTGRGEKVTDTSNSSNNYGYNSSSTYYKRLIEDLTFVPQSSTDRTITIEYTGYVNNSRDSFTGKIEITIGASGNLNYTIAKNDILELDADDFNSFFKKSSSTSGSLDYIVFNKLPSSSSGTLYFKYDKDSNRNTAVARNEKYYDRGTDAIDDVTFVAADGYTGTVTIPFTAYGSGSNNNVSGTLSIKVGKKGDSDIAYTTDRNTPVQVNIRDFNQFCEDATGDSRVDYVTFSLPSSNRGTLYGVYSSSNSSSQNTALKSSTRCYRNPGSKDIALDDVTFVPASGYTGTVSISFSGYSSSGKKFSGTMKITVGKDSGDITYTADSGQVITFKLADFTEYCKDELGSKATLDYVTFDQPAASKGTLYYDYSNNSGTQVKSSTRYYRNEKPYLDQVSFVPARNLTGTIQIPFYGHSTAKEEFEGVIVINYNTIKEPGVIRYTTNGSPVPFSLQDFTRACNERGGAQLDFVKFPIPDSTCGKLYSGYRSAAQNSGQISPNLTYRVSGTPPLAEVVFVPKAGYTGLARLNYTGTDKNGAEFSGVVEITITAPTSSGTFADVGANYSWAAASVDYLYRAGVVTGTDATHFAPAQNITRGDFVLMLYRAFGLQNAGTASFTDVPQDSYYAQAIAAAKAMGIATGGGGGTFNPTSPLTRQDAMLLIQRTINATGGSLRDGAEASLSTFADRGNVAPYAQGAVSALVQAGIIKGDNAGRLNPTGSLSRAEMATILHRVLTM